MKALAITTSRADWNGLSMVATALSRRGAEVKVAALAHHPATDAIRDDGFDPLIFGREMKQPMSYSSRLIAGDAMAMIDLAQEIDKHRPDVAVIVGDRHEMVGVAFTCALKDVAIAHIAGGDVTGGSQDENWRHAITKISHLHFPTNHEAAHRIIRMGEQPGDVFMLGSPSADRVLKTVPLNRVETLALVGLPGFIKGFVLANWQPELGQDITPMIDALLEQGAYGVIVGPNPDVGAPEVRDQLRRLSLSGKWQVHANLPPRVYLSCLHHALCLAGNSSSGFYEAPYLGTPVINIGDRQKARGPKPNCMTNVDANPVHIKRALSKVILAGRYPVEYVFGKGNSADLIALTIVSQQGRKTWRKQFHD